MFDFGTRLKNLRKSKGVTQKQLAKEIGASQRGVQQIELGESKPSYDTLIALADYFDVSLDYLMGRSDVPVSRRLTAKFEKLSESEQEAVAVFINALGGLKRALTRAI